METNWPQINSCVEGCSLSLSKLVPRLCPVSVQSTFNTEKQSPQRSADGVPAADRRRQGYELSCTSAPESISLPLQLSSLQSTSTMIGSLLLLWVCVVSILLLLKSWRPKNFPPGPIILPILGNILELSLENPLKDFERVRKSLRLKVSLF